MSGRFETREQQLEWQTKLCNRVDEFGKGLSPWEVERVAEWKDQLEIKKRPLSEKQVAILKRLESEKIR